MQKIIEKAKHYKIVAPRLYGRPAHEVDAFTPPPTLLKPPPARAERGALDVSDFPRQQTVPMPEGIPYNEGNYRPASIPLHSGYYPYNVYLQQGKVYWYCSCGISYTNPFCDWSCNKIPTRNRPIYFNVSESAYYKLCTCKVSANSPFCDGSHRKAVRFYAGSYRGFYEFFGIALYSLGWVYYLWNYYT